MIKSKFESGEIFARNATNLRKFTKRRKFFEFFAFFKDKK